MVAETYRWVRSVARVCGVPPAEMTIAEARDIANTSKTIRTLKEFAKNA